MSKKVVTWGPPRFQDPNSPFLKGTKTFKELWEEGQKIEREQEEARGYLQKAMPGLEAIFNYKIQKGEAFVVMRPLTYKTSALNTEEDDGFYSVRKSESNIGKFIDKSVTVMPGTVLMLKGFDSVLREFLFQDGTGKEHPISMDEKNLLLTQTDVFETVKKYFETKGE